MLWHCSGFLQLISVYSGSKLRGSDHITPAPMLCVTSFVCGFSNGSVIERQWKEFATTKNNFFIRQPQYFHDAVTSGICIFYYCDFCLQLKKTNKPPKQQKHFLSINFSFLFRVSTLRDHVFHKWPHCEQRNMGFSQQDDAGSSVQQWLWGLCLLGFWNKSAEHHLFSGEFSSTNSPQKCFRGSFSSFFPLNFIFRRWCV